MTRFIAAGSVWMVLLIACATILPTGVGAMAADAEDTSSFAVRDDWKPISEAEVAEARRLLDRTVARLDERLTEDGSGGDAWRAYLKWAILAEALRQPQPDLGALDEVYWRFDADYRGLELVWFADVRLAARHYLNLRRGVGNPEMVQTAFERLRESLPGRLRAYAKAPTPSEAAVLGEALGWLADFEQGRGLLREVDRRLRRPNCVIELSRSLVSAGLAGPIDEPTPIRDVILGTTIRGTGQTEGELSVEFLPDEEDAVVDLVMLARTESTNVGYNGPVRIYSQGTTDLGARKRLLISAEGIRALPSVAEAATRTKIQGVRAVRGGRIVEKIAWRKVCQSKRQAEAISSQHAEERLNRRIDQQAAEMVRDANEGFHNRFRRPLWERRILPDPLRFSTTEDAVRVVGLTAGPTQLAAPNDPPKLEKPLDLSVRVHESMINNAAATLLAGRTLSEEDFLATLGDLLGEVPERFQPDEEDEPWAIQFAPREPFTVTFADGGLTMAIHAVKFNRGGSEHPGMDVKATYKIDKADGKYVLVRQGELWIFPPGFEPGKGRISTREQTLRQLLEKRFGRILEATLKPRGELSPKGRWEKVGKLRVAHWTSQGGWMTLGWNLSKKAAP